MQEIMKNFNTNSKVSLNLKQQQVKCDGSKVVVKFNQDFALTSFKIKKIGDDPSCEACNMKRIPVTNFSSNVNKELQLERVRGEWKIVKELVSK